MYLNIKNYSFYYNLRILPFVEEIWLFGSRAKGKETKTSDIDLAILCSQATDNDWQKIQEILYNRDTLLNIDCIRLDTLKDEKLHSEIKKDGVLLFKRVKNNHEWYEMFLDLGQALDRFSYALDTDPEKNSLAIEATIQIFEYCFELYWKLLKKMCLEQGIIANGPRDAFTQSYALDLIADEKKWLKILEDRNLTSHTYRHPMAIEIYEHCKIYHEVMQETYKKLKDRFKV